MVLPGVLFQGCGGEVLVPKARLVDELHTAFPISVEQLSGSRARYVVLASHEVPHEIPPVHPVQLVIQEVIYVREEGRLLVLSALDGLPLTLHI